MTERQVHAQNKLPSFLLSLIFPRVGGESRAEQVFFSAATFFGAYFFAGTQAFFGTCPFGPALLAVVRNRPLLCYFGLVTGIIFTGGTTAPVYIALYTAVLLMRCFFSAPREGNRFLPASRAYFHEMPQLRIAVAAVTGLLTAVYEIVVGGLNTVSLFYALGMVLFVPCAAFLYLAALECDFTLAELIGIRKTDEKERLSAFGPAAPYYLIVSEIALAATLTLSLKPFSLFGFSIPYLAAAGATLFAAKRKGAAVGALCGAAVSAPLALLSVPAFVALGFLSGILMTIGAVYAALAGIAASGLLLFITGGVSGFLSAWPETATAAALCLPIFSGLFNKEKNRAAAGDTVVCYQQNSDLEHIGRLSGALSNLSATFGNMADYMRLPDKGETLSLCRRIAEQRCALCEKRSDCKHAASTAFDESLRTLSDRLCTGDRNLSGVFSEAQLSDCGYLGTLLTDIRAAVADDIREKERNGTGDLLAADYAMLSKILSDTAVHDREEREEDKRLSTDLCAALESHGGFHGSVTVFGKRQKQILVSGSHWEGRRLSVDEIRILFEQLCCCRLSEPTFDFSSGQMTLQTHTERRFDAVFTSATLPGGGEMSGDVIRSFENAEHYSYTLLSDGMGSGRTASMTAELTGVYLYELLSAGAASDTALKMLNQVIRQKGCECSATVDLLELDLLYGKASFIKSGAATSYVRRGNDVFRIRSKTMPIGLLRTMDAERIHFDLAAGDVIIMLSDGVSQVPEDAPWLVSLLSDEFDDNLPAMAEKIIDAAKSAGKNDDMTVGLVRITDHR